MTAPARRPDPRHAPATPQHRSMVSRGAIVAAMALGGGCKEETPWYFFPTDVVDGSGDAVDGDVGGDDASDEDAVATDAGDAGEDVADTAGDADGGRDAGDVAADAERDSDAGDAGRDTTDTASDPDTADSADERIDVDVSDIADVADTTDTPRDTTDAADAPRDTSDTSDAGGDVAIGSCGMRPPACRLDGGAATTSTISAWPGSWVRCVAPMTVDGFEVIAPTWSVVRRPAGSTSSLLNGVGDDASLVLDTAGLFELRYSGTDESGCTATSPVAEITVSTVGAPDIRYVITWNQPGDDDPTDEGFGAGADLDAHMRHWNGCWESTAWDCHFRARTPDWGVTGRTDDNPALQVDDTNGWGPEIITLQRAEAGVLYTLAVDHYDDADFGASTVDAVVYLRGVREWTGSQTLSTVGGWWVAAQVDWATQSVTGVDQVSAAIPTCP